MKLLDENVYKELADRYFNENNISFRRVFLSTEDPITVEKFQTFRSFDTSFAAIPRNNHNGKAPFDVNQVNETLYALFNLDLALQCDAWICTLASNWCMLIERLRSTIRCKANGVYIRCRFRL